MNPQPPSTTTTTRTTTTETTNSDPSQSDPHPSTSSGVFHITPANESNVSAGSAYSASTRAEGHAEPAGGPLWGQYQYQEAPPPPPLPPQDYGLFSHQRAHPSPSDSQGYSSPHVQPPTSHYQGSTSREYQLHPIPQSNVPRPLSRSQLAPSPYRPQLQPPPPVAPQQGRPPAPGRQGVDVVHPHDVLSGRGVNVAQHPGNERFRALVHARSDHDYCADYTTSEKRAVARQIIAHIRGLDPPGRFLKRPARPTVRTLEGPWFELNMDEAVKKTCQALRDCNRQDRTGYATSVSVPDDVRENSEWLTHSGLTLKEQAKRAAAKAKREAEEAAERVHLLSSAPSMAAPAMSVGSVREGTISPSVENAAQWLKRQRTDLGVSSATHALPRGGGRHPSDPSFPAAGVTPSTSGPKLDRGSEPSIVSSGGPQTLFDPAFFSHQSAVYTPHVAPPAADHRDVSVGSVFHGQDSYPFGEPSDYSAVTAMNSYAMPVPTAPSTLTAGSFNAAHHLYQQHHAHYGGHSSLEPLQVAATAMASLDPPHPNLEHSADAHHHQPLGGPSHRHASAEDLPVGGSGSSGSHDDDSPQRIDFGGQDDSNDLTTLSLVDFRGDGVHDDVDYDPRDNPFSED